VFSFDIIFFKRKEKMFGLEIQIRPKNLKHAKVAFGVFFYALNGIRGNLLILTISRHTLIFH